MKFLATTYRTLSGTKEIIEIPKKRNTQWVVYQDNIPKYYVDFYDLDKESNAMMNSLVLCTETKIEDVLKHINKTHHVNLSIPKISRFPFFKKIKSEPKELDLQPIPEKWLSYSL